MSRKKSQLQKWLVAMALAAGLLPAGILALWWFVGATATQLHPDPGAVPSTAAAAPSTSWTDAIEDGRQAVRAMMAEENLPGLSVAVAVSGTTVWAEGFGWADLEQRVPVTPQTRFRIGTASTALTSAAVGLLLEQQRLTLDEKIQTWVPAFPEQPSPITLRQLMGHVSGVRNDGGDEGPLFGTQCERAVDALPAFAESRLLFEPGTRYRDSSYGWILVSAAIESVASESVSAFMRRHIFEPLGMDNTRREELEPVSTQAISYFPRFAADPRYGLHLMRPADYSCYAGASGFLSTPSDLVRFGTAINAGTLLQPGTVQLLQTSQRLTTGEETGYGLGWDLEMVDLAGKPARAAGHDGDVLGGMVASLLTVPEHGLVVAVTSNISYAGTHTLAVKIAQAFTGAAAGG